MINLNGVNIKFTNGQFMTENPDVIQRLEENDAFGIKYQRIDKNGKPPWKKRLKKVDKPDKWSSKTLEAFKQGEEIKRCKHECGFATTHIPALSKHEKNCANKNTNDNLEES